MGDFNRDDHETWKLIMGEHKARREQQIHPVFVEGLKKLPIHDDEIPDLDAVNRVLKAETGFQGKYVKGLEDGESFYAMLARREFPIGHFIRSKIDINYTPEPDVIHDLYGHLPFLMNGDYADFSAAYGALVSKYINNPKKLRMFERFYWFTIEFALVKTKLGSRIFGAGIASSIGECVYALSSKPEVIPFSVDRIIHQEFRIDEMQPKIFLLDSPEQLYESLDEVAQKVESAL